ncbi:MAG TPA: SusD/RagB family nutrient-binding outer membrane lipoprotein [Longimicrobiales bacterium]|nr:SusD/RagB family nutrient-binding outer membrane lipoprotein [Longimicrobiales bacterium]
MRIKHSARLGWALALPLALGAAGCKSFLDVNEDPNAPVAARVDLRLTALVPGFIHSMYYGDTQLWGAEWTQQFAYNRDERNYAEIHRFELQETDASHAWDYDYASVLTEANDMMADADPETEPAYHGIAEFIYAWSFSHVTDMWGSVPFKEALNPSIREPKYDEQKVVYDSIYKLLDHSIAEMSKTGGRRPAANDLLFNGDMGRWVKLARTVQARLQLRLAYAPGEDKVAHAQKALAALAQGIASNAEDADFAYPGGVDARNPLWTFQDPNVLPRLTASNFMVELLKSRNDPRLPIMIQPVIYDSVRGTTRFPAKTVSYRGHVNGGPQDADSTISFIGSFFTKENAALNVASYADAKFTEAEARLIASGAAAADAPYREGIRANMQKLGVPTDAIATYLAARPSLGSVPSALEEIITEKYIANFLKVEPWNDWRRTGYPKLPPVDKAVLPGPPQRIRTPGSELSNNYHSVLASGVPTGLEGMSVKVWWASQGPK